MASEINAGLAEAGYKSWQVAWGPALNADRSNLAYAARNSETGQLAVSIRGSDFSFWLKTEPPSRRDRACYCENWWRGRLPHVFGTQRPQCHWPHWSCHWVRRWPYPHPWWTIRPLLPLNSPEPTLTRPLADRRSRPITDPNGSRRGLIRTRTIEGRSCAKRQGSASPSSLWNCKPGHHRRADGATLTELAETYNVS
jgi:hypothetical protein